MNAAKIKRLFRRRQNPGPRPYWHVDLKWLCALLLIAGLFVTLPVAAMYRLTAKEPASDLVAYSLAGLTSPKGIDSGEGLGDIQKRVAEKGSETVTLAGIEVTFTAADVAELSPRELRLKVFGAFAERFYNQGLEGFAQSQGLDQAATEKFKKDASFVSVFSAATHDKLGTALAWLLTLDVLFLAGAVLFSRRFGRLVSPGVVLFIVGLPGILLSIIAQQNTEVSGTARTEEAAEPLAMIGSFASFVAPLVVPHVATVYMLALWAGIILLLLAAAGKIIYTIKRHHTQGGTEQSIPSPKDTESTRKP